MARITKPLEERRQEIIETAREMFFQNGFEKTQVTDISKKMNVASGLVYHYFKSKTDILYAVIDELAAEKLRKTQKALDGSNSSALERLKLLFSPTRNPDKLEDTHEKLFGGLASDKAIMKYCRQKMSASSLPALCSLIEDGNADGSWNCEYPKETAVFILNGLMGILELPDGTWEPGERFNFVTDTVLRVLGARSSQG